MTFPSFTTGEVLTAADMNAVGLWLVKTQTIGSAVSTVTVTGAFSTDFDNYRILISGGVGSTTALFQMTLGSTTTGYNRGGIFMNYNSATVNGFAEENVAAFNGAGLISTANLSMELEVKNPFLASRTEFLSRAMRTVGSGLHVFYNGYLDNATSYTAFTLTPNTGTITGGTIRVYGYRN